MPGIKFESFGVTVDVEAVKGEGVVTSGITSFMIKKGVKTHDMEGHIDAILKIVVLEP